MTSTEIKEILDTLQSAIKTAIANGGVASYSINTGQTQTNVRQASLKELREEHNYWQSVYNETKGLEDGSNISYARDVRNF